MLLLHVLIIDVIIIKSRCYPVYDLKKNRPGQVALVNSELPFLLDRSKKKIFTHINYCRNSLV